MRISNTLTDVMRHSLVQAIDFSYFSGTFVIEGLDLRFKATRCRFIRHSGEIAGEYCSALVAGKSYRESIAEQEWNG